MNSFSDVPDTDPMIGSLLADRYRIDQRIGRGGMGSVYLAHQLGLERKVAIKVLLPEFVRSTRESERFRREALATAKLRHPNVVSVHDFGLTQDGRAYLVMEYLGGPTLERWLAEHGACTRLEAFEILRPICLAIDASHRAGIVHRDLKPSNIILPNPEEPDDTLRVVDFGIARLHEIADESDLTGQRMLGTPAYMAPEQMEASRADSRSDIYSIGCIAYELLAGERPFRASSRNELLIKHLCEVPPPPSSIRPELSPEIDAVVLKALAKEPDARFATARDMAEALGRALEVSTADEQVRHLRSIAERDELTDLANRRAFYARLAEAKGRADREHHPFAVAIFDVDDFKRVNDVHGNLAGDDALRRVAAVIVSSIRNSGTAFRYAGDEFAVLLDAADSATVRATLRTVCDRVRTEATLGEQYELSVSAGATVYSGGGAPPEVIVGTADRALFFAKQGGKDGVHVLTVEATGSLVQTPQAARSGESASPELATSEPARGPRRLRFEGFAGREREIALLRESIARSRADETCAALVVGDPGLGKTALAARVLDEATDAIVVETRFVEGALAPPYRPFVEALGAYLASRSVPITEVSSTPSEARALDAIARGDSTDFVEALGASATDADRYRAFELLARAFRRVAREALVVLLVEDLQWADALSLELLAYLIGASTDGRFFVLATARPDALVDGAPLRPWARGLARTGRFERIELGPLRRADVRAIVSSLGGRSDRRVEVTDSVVERLTRETDGNPLFVTEVLRLWASDGTLAFDPQAGAWRVGPISAIGLPVSVAEVYEARLSQTDPRLCEMLRTAAVVGDEFALDVLSAVDGRSEDELLDLVDEAVRGGLLVELHDRRDDAFRFAHTAARRVLEASLTGARRRRLHAKIAAALEDLRAAKRQVDDADLMRHLRAARALDRAATYAVAAADAAWRAWTIDRAEEALDVLDEARDDGVNLAPELAARGYVLRAETEAMRGRVAPAVAGFEKAIASLDASAGDDSALRVRALRGLGRLRADAGETDRARSSLAEALDIATSTGLVEDAAPLKYAMGRAYDATGDFDGALDWIERGLAEARAQDDRAIELLGEIERGPVLCRLGRYSEALDAGHRAREIAVALGDRKREWQALNLLGLVYHERADAVRSYEHFVAACDVARGMGDLIGEVRLLTNIGETHRRAGHFDDAITCYEQILAIAPDAGPRTREGLAVNLALAYVGLGDVATARRHVEEAETLNVATGDSFQAAYTAYAAAEAALLDGDAASAATAAARAVELARALRSPEVEWQALWAAARAARLRDEREIAVGHLRASAAVIEAMAAELGAPEDRARFLADKRAVFDALGEFPTA